MPGQIICVECSKRHPASKPHDDGKDGKRRWLVKVYKGRDQETGGQVYVSRAVLGTKKEAQTALNAWLPDKDRGTLVQPSRMTLNAYLDEWLTKAAKARLRPRTYVEYEKLLKRYVRPALGSMRLSAISPLHVQGLYTDLQAKGLAPKTVRHVHTTLHRALRQAVEWRFLQVNPVSSATPPSVPRQELQTLTRPQVAAFLAECDKDPLGLVFKLALATGMRPSEYLALRWEDVNLKGGTVTVRRVVVQRVSPWIYQEPKTPQSRRTLHLPATITQALREHRAASPFKKPADPVFASHEGRPLDEHSTVRRRFKAILKAAGLPAELRLYSLRHAAASLLLEQTGNLKLVAAQLGHSTITLTADVYSHIAPATQQEAAEKLDAVFSGSRYQRDT
jgi:integrase